MKLYVDENMNLTITEHDQKNVVNVALSSTYKKCKSALRIESITMIDYMPVINGIAVIPHSFDVCKNINLSVIVNYNNENIETNRINISMKGGS